MLQIVKPRAKTTLYRVGRVTVFYDGSWVTHSSSPLRVLLTPTITENGITDSGHYRKWYYRLQPLQKMVLQTPAITENGVTDSSHYRKWCYRLQPLQKMVLQTPAITENGVTDSGRYRKWCYRLQPLQKMVELIPTGSLDFFRTGQKVRTVCLPARSTLILTICLCPWRA